MPEAPIIAYGPPEEIPAYTTSYPAFWNLVALSAAVDNSEYSNLFPLAIAGTLYGFDGTYFNTSELSPGNGYWINMDEAHTNSIYGGVISNVTIDIAEGWNLVGGPFCEGENNNEFEISLTSDPDSIITPGTLYGFNGTYQNATAMIPGRGYWWNAQNSGQVTLTCQQ